MFYEPARTSSLEPSLKGQKAFARGSPPFSRRPAGPRLSHGERINAAGSTIRYRSIVERRDGTTIEFFDAGEIDAAGRISTMLVFTGPLADAN
ncbi:MAG: hypothetical protein H0T46_10435 [Deltaproteobacteria bacterium]|nr:hypothetical protein [Deltaproteobacteria bacterium]